MTVRSAPRSKSYPPALYDAVHGHRSVDEAFYASVARGAEHVLELGSGSGRIAAIMAHEGARVVGLDSSAAAVASARKAVPAATFHVGDMRHFDLDRTFDRIVCPYNGLYCLLTEADLRSTLDCVRRHLRPGGLFVFDGYAADHFHHDYAEDVGEGTDEEVVDDDPFVEVVVDGQRWAVVERHGEWERDEQRLIAEYEHRPADGGEPVVSTIPQRYLLRNQVEDLLADAGLITLVVHGDFDQSVWDEESPHLIVTAMAPVAEA